MTFDDDEGSEQTRLNENATYTKLGNHTNFGKNHRVIVFSLNSLSHITRKR